MCVIWYLLCGDQIEEKTGKTMNFFQNKTKTDSSYLKSKLIVFLLTAEYRLLCFLYCACGPLSMV